MNEPTAEQIAANRLHFVEEQIMMIRAGLTDRVRCPYCLSMVIMDGEFCCERFKKATAAVLDKMDMDDRKDQANRIADRVN